MVLSGSKMATNAASISNSRQGGGPKKQGLVSSIGRPASVFNNNVLQRTGWCCMTLNRTLKPTFVSWIGGVGQTQPKYR